MQKRRTEGFFGSPLLLVYESLLAAEGLAVGALIHRRIIFVSAYRDAVERAIVVGRAVVGALRNSAANAFVCLIHGS